MEQSSSFARPDADFEVDRCNIPDAYMDPITKSLIRDPVTATDGHTYERESIMNWILNGNSTSPVTNEVNEVLLEPMDLRPNITLKKAIDEFLEDDSNKDKNNSQLGVNRLGLELAKLRMELVNSEKNRRDILLRSRDLLPAIESIQDGGPLSDEIFLRKAVTNQHTALRPMDTCLALIQIFGRVQ